MRTETATVDAPPGPTTPSEQGSRPLAPGRRLGPYELLLPIASGGMGHVWAAARIGEFGFRRKVAVKVMREELASNGEFRRMFLDEARVAAKVVHTNVVEVLDLGVADGMLYQAMTLVDGASLAELLRMHARVSAAPVPVEIAVGVVVGALRGLHAAHVLRSEDGSELALVHRDVSPQNILVGLDGVAKLTDFGIAKATGAVTELSERGTKGKRPYMAPEQLTGGDIDRRADVFAAGVVSWELLAGRALVDAGERLLDGRRLERPDSPFSAIVMRALERAPEDRFATAEAMAEALESVAQTSGLALSPAKIAAWASALVAERVEQRNIDADARLALSDADATLQLPGAAPAIARPLRSLAPVDPPPSPWSPLRAVAAVVIPLAIVGGVYLVRAQPAPEPDEPAVVSVPASSTEPIPPPASAEVISAPSPPGEAPPARRTRRHATPRPTASAAAPTVAPPAPIAPSPKYDNPYAR